MLAAGAPKGLECKVSRITPLFQRHLADRARHVGDGDLEEAASKFMSIPIEAGLLAYLSGQL